MMKLINGIFPIVFFSAACTHVIAQEVRGPFLQKISLRGEYGDIPFQRYRSTLWKSVDKAFQAYNVAITAEYAPPDSRWVANVSIAGNWGTYKDGNMFAVDGNYNYVHERYHASFYTVLAGGRYCYVRNNGWSLYSGLQVGYTRAFYETTYKEYYFSKNRLASQLTLLGVEFGKRLRGFIECGWGARGCGTLGIKYHF